MSWWSKKVKKHVGKIAGIGLGTVAGMLTGGAGFAPTMAALGKTLGWGLLGGLAGGLGGDSIDTAHAAANEAEKQERLARERAEEQRKEALAAAEAESINADRTATRLKKRYGRASTILDADYRQRATTAAKRLTGE